MKRRDCIALFTGASLLAPRAAVAQQTPAKRKVGVLGSNLFSYGNQKAIVEAFRQGLAALGWVEGRNLEIDVRASSGTVMPAAAAAELVDLSPDAIFAISSAHVQALQARTRTIPIVFVGVGNPIGLHIVRSLARPGGNVTGFANYDSAMGGKWLQLLTQIAPQVSHVVVLFNPLVPTAPGFVQAIRAAAKTARIPVSEVSSQRTSELERATGLGSGSVSGLIVLPGALLVAKNGEPLSIGIAARRRLPAMYTLPGLTAAGGLIAYVEDEVADARRAATYVDRILRGAKPGDLPIQYPTTYDLSINLKTAKALGLAVPQSILLQATQVIR